MKSQIITKTYRYNADLLKPQFYIVELGFTWVYINFLIFAQNIDCGYRGGSNEYQQSMFLSKNMKNIRFFFYLKMFIFSVVKFSIYLNRRDFVMCTSKEELQQKNLIGMVNRKMLWDLNQFYSRKTSPSILMQLQITNMCSIRKGHRYLISETHKITKKKKKKKKKKNVMENSKVSNGDQ